MSSNTHSSSTADPHGAMLGHLPEHQRRRILSGMRWTVWLSAFAVPFSIAVNLLLARVGPVTLGNFGLLGLYISLTSSFLYFGGDAVIMRFIPECSLEDRASFLVSYLIVILVVMSGWLVFAWLCPAAIRLAFGESNDDRFNFLLLCLSILPISFAMVVASLKGMLEIKISQLLTKLLTIGALAIYAAIFVFDRSLLSVHPTASIWSAYLGLSALLGIIGAVRVVRLCRTQRVRWFLPADFWRYSLSTQQVSALTFLARRLDYVLIVNLGGVRLLGQYVAVMVVATTVPIVSGFFMDTLLPALTNTVAMRNYAGAAQVFTVHMRILFLVITLLSCAVVVLAVPTTALMGSKYASVGGLIMFMAAAYGIASPGAVGGTILASIGRQQLAVWALGLNLLLYICLFFPLWWRWNLTGAVVAYGLALVISNAILMATALRTGRFFPSISGLWVKSATVQAIVSFVALWWMPLGLTSAVLLWVGGTVIFLWWARYSPSECKNLIQMFLPGSAWNASSDANPPFADRIQPGVASS
jgi:O-antigen/teichoic acid export membrane protein